MMVLASEEDAGCIDHGDFWTVVIVSGVCIVLSGRSSFGVEAPSVPADRWRRVVDPEVRAEGVGLGDGDRLRPRIARLNFGRCVFFLLNRSELSCCGVPAGFDRGDVVSLVKRALLFLCAAAEI